MSKCICGYECRLPGEQAMLERYGCAKTIERREQPFNNLTVIMCDRESGAPINDIPDDTAYTEAFKQKYQKPNKNGPTS